MSASSITRYSFLFFFIFSLIFNIINYNTQGFLTSLAELIISSSILLTYITKFSLLRKKQGKKNEYDNVPSALIGIIVSFILLMAPFYIVNNINYSIIIAGVIAIIGMITLNVIGFNIKKTYDAETSTSKAESSETK